MTAISPPSGVSQFGKSDIGRPPTVLSTGRGLIALFWLSLRQYCRARRFIILVFLFLLPGALGVLIQRYAPSPRWEEVEFALVLSLIPHALLPLSALLFASGMIQDELEDQTLTYLLMRPLPKWTIYLVKLLAAVFVCLALAITFTAATYIAMSFGTPALSFQFLWPKLAATVPAIALALVCYCAIFGFVSLMTRRTFVVGAAYIVLVEGIIANIDFAVRRLTVVYYFRVLVERWGEASALLKEKWSIDPARAPTASECLGTLLVASAVFVLAALVLFSVREFRLKTPEGS